MHTHTPGGSSSAMPKESGGGSTSSPASSPPASCHASSIPTSSGAASAPAQHATAQQQTWIEHLLGSSIPRHSPGKMYVIIPSLSFEMTHFTSSGASSMPAQQATRQGKKRVSMPSPHHIGHP
eukprot:1160617-Pelagomonas_calceolata.AAC.9